MEIPAATAFRTVFDKPANMKSAFLGSRAHIRCARPLMSQQLRFKTKFGVGFPEISCCYNSKKYLYRSGGGLARSEGYDDFKVGLPQHVAIVANNDRYLTPFTLGSYTYLKCSGTDMGTVYTPLEIFTNADGYMRVKNKFNGKFWMLDPEGWVCANSSDGAASSCLFEPVKVDENTIALRHKDTNKFLLREENNDPKRPDCVRANLATIQETCKFRVVETVLQRSVLEVQYDLQKARLYGETALVLATQTGRNQTDTPQQMTLNFTYSDTATQCWSNAVSLHTGVSTTFKAGVPFIAKAEVTVSAEVGFEHSWEDTITETKEVQTGYNTTIPPRTKSSVNLMAIKGSCDVPFSYKQIDRLTNGDKVEITLKDGVFTGVNTYDFYYETLEEPLPPEECI